MTFCIAMRVEDGLVGLADTQVTTGTERITARKVTVHQHGRHSLFLMTSGLRSARDKALTYFEEVMEESDEEFDRLYKAVNAFSEQLRRVSREDKVALEESGLQFNLHTIVGGQLERDAEHRLYLIYPQGNWVEVGISTPYFVIGESAYGKPLLDRSLAFQSGMERALKVGVLAFDATRRSATDVNYPLDVVLYRRDSFEIVEHRYTEADLARTASWWEQHICEAVDSAPAPWLEDSIGKLPSA